MKDLLISISVLIFIGGCGPSQNISDNSSSAQLETVLDAFDPSPGWGSLTSGNDFSTASFEAGLVKVREQLDLLNRIDTADLGFNELIDWKFAKSILNGRVIEEGSMMFWKRDPRRYMAFRSLANLIQKPGDPISKVDELKARLILVPKQLQNGTDQLNEYVPRFGELALFMAQNARSIFTSEIPLFAEALVSGRDSILDLNQNALTNLDSFIYYLENEFPLLRPGDFAIGQEIYDRMLLEKFLLSYGADSLWKFGKEQFAKTIEELESIGQTIDPSQHWQSLATQIKESYPHRDSMIEAHQYWVDRSKRHILEKELIPIPWNERVDVVPRAEYLRKTSYYGNFSRARGQDDEGIFVAQWMINPFEHDWDEITKQDYLNEHDWGVIIVTAPHESYGGHHVQGLYQMHNPSKLRRENGISLFSEGWGLYNEQLMRETGFLPDDKILLRQLQLRLWRNARVVYDVGLHTGRMSYKEAVRMMVEEVGFLEWAAQLEIDAATSRPGYFIGYFLGMYDILQMRKDYQERVGSEYSHSEFHERLLKIGNMPTSLMRDALFYEL